jgi:hypothetical protein
MKAAQVLEEAAVLVQRGWTQHVPARDASNLHVPWNSAAATSWCIIGAVWRAAGGVVIGNAVLPHIAKVIGKEISSWNDCYGRTQEEVVKVLRAAALRSQEE